MHGERYSPPSQTTVVSTKPLLEQLSIEVQLQAPPQLFLAGDVSLLQHPLRVAVVGSRTASPEGLLRARRLARLLARAGAVVVSGLATPDEVRALEDYREVYRLEGAMNAAGNVILANDSFAAVHPDMPIEVAEEIGTFLGVPVRRLTFAGIKTVGMAAVATNKGVLVHARSTDAEIADLAECAEGLQIGTGTVNMGSGLVGTGVLANSRGYVVGFETTGFELGRIEEVFGFLE